MMRRWVPVGVLVLGLWAWRPAAAQDLTTQLSKFLVDLRAGTLGATQAITTLVATGTVTASDYVSSGAGGGVFVASNAVQFRRNSSTGDAEIYSDNAVKLKAGTTDVIYASGVFAPLVTVTSINTAGAVTFSAAQLAGGLILRDCNGAGRADLVPTAANLLAELPSAAIGQGFEFTIRNTSGTAVSITVTANSGVTLSGTMTIAQNNTKRFLAVFTNVTAASEAYTLYSLGTVVH